MHWVRTANIPSTYSCTRVPSSDFIAPVTSHNPIKHSKHRRILLSNFVAQPEALAFGKTEEVVKELGLNASEALIKGGVFEANRPSTSITFPSLTTAMLGGSFFSSLFLGR